MRGCCLPASAIYFLSGGVWWATILVLLTVGLATACPTWDMYIQERRWVILWNLIRLARIINRQSPFDLLGPSKLSLMRLFFFFFFLRVTNYEIVWGDDEMVLELTADLHKWTAFFIGNDGPKITAILDLGWIALKQSRGNNGNIAVALWGGWFHINNNKIMTSGKSYN